ncbi:MAG: hypothetical protein H6696_17775 [Deferribacteres bacterium]|nr:hypothetical protein [candidate division KSB1 bacterium]MCB9503785.1 hypothetical protein [Deferribacteres bacterium]
MVRIMAVLSFVMLIMVTMACQNSGEKNGGPVEIETQDINQVLAAHSDELMAIPGVVGINIGLLEEGGSTLCIRVMVKEMTAELQKTIPHTLDGHPVKIQVTGEIKAF